MQEFLDKLSGPNGGQIIGLVFWLGVITAVIATVAITQWRKYRQARVEAVLKRSIIDLKQQMIERGMSAEEIERVLNAQPPTGSQASVAAHRPLQETADYKA